MVCCIVIPVIALRISNEDTGCGDTMARPAEFLGYELEIGKIKIKILMI